MGLLDRMDEKMVEEVIASGDAVSSSKMLRQILFGRTEDMAANEMERMP